MLDIHPGGLLRLRRLGITGGLQALVNPPDTVERTGGGVLIRAGGALELEDVRIHDNRSNRDGGGVSVFGSLLGTRVRLLANSAHASFGAGGGIHIGNTASLVDFDECEISGNGAATGAGIQGNGAPAIAIRRCLIASNDAGNDGGGGVAANSALPTGCSRTSP